MCDCIIFTNVEKILCTSKTAVGHLMLIIIIAAEAKCFELLSNVPNFKMFFKNSKPFWDINGQI